MIANILLVDDDQKLLDGYKRNLGHEFNTDFALGPEEGLALLNSGRIYSVVVSDMRMPGMNGIEFLKKTKTISPQTIRIMLTGNSDIETAIDAVNHGNVYKFLLKPCLLEDLKKALTEGINEYILHAGEFEAANIDILTGLHNRRRLEEKIAEENNFRKRYVDIKRSYTILFIDLDNFKYYNDTYGHPVGDLLLKEFAGIIKDVSRTTDFAARFGGDEFFILLPETDIEGASVIAERIKTELEKANQFQSKIESQIGKPINPENSMKLSCSIGIAEASENIELQEALKHADESVLEAKRTGKNCFVVWGRS